MTVSAGLWGRALAALGVTAALVLGLLVAFRLAQPASRQFPTMPPPPDGFFALLPPGSFASLPTDAEAAAKVHQSAWEPRPANTHYNHTFPRALHLMPRPPADHAYDPRWNRYVISRISGRYSGTTDEIFQWAAAKWGVPDNLLRTIAYMESDWKQRNLGDYVRDHSKCPAGYRRVPCPVTFGIVGTKSTSWPGIYPWNRKSTAAAVDVLGGWLRGCYEGWVWWLRQHGNTSRGVYHAGDIWGCVGAWFSGNWHDGPPGGHGGQNYQLRAQYWSRVRPWLHPHF
jgi:autotransporter family porin